MSCGAATGSEAVVVWRQGGDVLGGGAATHIGKEEEGGYRVGEI